jgi:hypothetical protein
MRLSDAIREGAKMGPQKRGQLYGADGASCAWGAAFMAIGEQDYTVDSGDWDHIIKRHGWAFVYQTVELPTNDRPDRLISQIAWLNDYCGWTREQIADWIEQYEPKVEAVVEEQELVGATA